MLEAAEALVTQIDIAIAVAGAGVAIVALCYMALMWWNGEFDE